jgi:hypothetical protein
MNAIRIDLTYRAGDRTWNAAIMDVQGNVIWRSVEQFHSADIAYYRAMGQFVLRGADDTPTRQSARAMEAQLA